MRNLTLERAVATVDQEEAKNGASQSDQVRLASREQSKLEASVPLSVYLSRAAQFRSSLKKSKTEEPKKTECPIEKARAESTTGENAPLNWLVADHFGGQADSFPSSNDVVSKDSDFQPKEAALTSLSLQSQPMDSTPSLLQDEWLLSPNS